MPIRLFNFALVLIFAIVVARPETAYAQNHIKISKDKIPEEQQAKTTENTSAPPDFYFLSDSGLNVGEALLKREKYTEAIAVFENVLKRNPRNVDAHAGIGAAYLGLGQTKRAGEALQTALSRDAKHAGGNYLMGLFYVETDQISKAVDQAQVLYMLCGRYACPEEEALSTAINRAKQEK